uniref:NADH-ubiquinone oxidoreductase chain 1 n=1 Tax=Cheiracanthium brevispinum TaxID=2773961 RepID=A0AA51Z318_9ARAC|nr:NADH dehydrogenase subunit 1 [Cheiracanthium brevispinum]WMX19918.1 NADH dehydrogenase subunit 1 [Cheiracanthium brevispinum]
MTISMLISVAFYTILERKILSYMQIRKGPNKVGFLGILQPFSDALKLFNKNLSNLEMANILLSMSMPALTLFISILIIPIINFNNFSMYDNKHNILLFFIISSMSVYSILMIGWSTNSKYSNLGSIRSVAQMISYEVSFFMMLLFISIMSFSYSFYEMMMSQNFLIFFLGNIILFMMWITSCLAETNRAPFDFAESESELVSGFNIEYMGGWFALIFLAEYMSMIILSMITTIMFFSFPKMLISPLILVLITIILLWVRATYPRFRYDLLMNLSWKLFLPTSLFIIILSMNL